VRETHKIGGTGGREAKGSLAACGDKTVTRKQLRVISLMTVIGEEAIKGKKLVTGKKRHPWRQG